MSAVALCVTCCCLCATRSCCPHTRESPLAVHLPSVLSRPMLQQHGKRLKQQPASSSSSKQRLLLCPTWLPGALPGPGRPTGTAQLTLKSWQQS